MFNPFYLLLLSTIDKIICMIFLFKYFFIMSDEESCTNIFSGIGEVGRSLLTSTFSFTQGVTDF